MFFFFRQSLKDPAAKRKLADTLFKLAPLKYLLFLKSICRNVFSLSNADYADLIMPLRIFNQILSVPNAVMK
jgi:hypothetical protein